ncbi:MAG: transposase [Caldilineaceae bacterium]|nr:transposase [Caldilineaceae bacterium]
MTTRTAVPDSTTEPSVLRAERYRVCFDNPQQAALCAQIAGACRYVWNHMLADCQWRYRMWKMYRIGPKPSVSFFTLGHRFTVLRNDPAHAWLQAYPASVVRYALKYLADAYARSFDSADAGLPHFKSRHRTTPGFTIPQDVRMDGTRLHIPKVGWVRLSGSGQYLGCRPKQVRVLKEGTERHPKWYAHVFHEVPADRVRPPAPTGDLGVDRNVGQATDSNGHVYTLPDTSNLDANIRRKQRKADKARERSRRNGQPLSHRGRRICGQLNRLYRKRRCKRENVGHQHSRKLADRAHTVVVEDLHTKAMTQSAKGTVEEPGRNVKSNWGRLERNLAYKAGALVKVDPAYTSQTCAVCQHVDKANRKTQAVFKCTACGHTANADHNAAINILAKGVPLARLARGVGASARRGAFPSGTPTTREPDRPGPGGSASVPSVNPSVYPSEGGPP